jgi:hypothetical protein
LSPVPNGTQASEFQLDAIVIVVANVVRYPSLQFIDVAKPVDMEELGLQGSKEAFHRGVIKAVGLARHALGDGALLQSVAIERLLVLGGFNRSSQR